jgi:hypothetical protein
MNGFPCLATLRLQFGRRLRCFSMQLLKEIVIVTKVEEATR